MSTEPKMKIRRDGQEIGAWDRFEIRNFLSQGSLLVTDEVFLEEEDRWISLVPAYRRKWNLYDWSDEEDQLWYYVSDGYIIGPRIIGEISTLFEAGYLSDDTLITSVGQNDWCSIGDLLAESPTEDLEVSAKEHAGDAFKKLVDGDKIGAGLSGFRALGKLWKDFTKEEELISEWLCLKRSDDMPPETEIAKVIEGTGFSPLTTEYFDSEDECMIAYCFSSIEEATQVRDTLQYEKLGDKWHFEFVGRQEQPQN